MKAHYRSNWEEFYLAHREGRRQILEKNIFDTWQQNSMPDSTAENYFWWGLPVLYSHLDEPLALAFFEKSLTISKRAMTEKKLVSKISKSQYPFNRGVLLRTQVYTSVLTGQNFDTNLLHQASVDLEKGSKILDKGEWDEMCEAHILEGIRLDLIVGDIGRAKRLLKVKKPFIWHSEEYNLWSKILQNFEPNFLRNSTLLLEFDDYFDKVQEPNYNPGYYIKEFIVSFELGIIRDKYFASQDATVNWKRIVDIISS